MSVRRFLQLHLTWGRKDKPPKMHEEGKTPDHVNISKGRFLEGFYSDSFFTHENTRFFDHFGDNNLPFGIASSPSRSQPSVAVRHNDLVFFLAELSHQGYLPALKQTALLEALNEVSCLIRHVHGPSATPSQLLTRNE
jgi:hypothetical protein